MRENENAEQYLFKICMDNFSQLIESDTPVLVDFHATWCGPCKAMAPVISEVAKNVAGKARVIKVDIDQSPKAANAYQVQAVPTLMIFRKGKIVWRHSGMIDKGSLMKAVEGSYR